MKYGIIVCPKCKKTKVVELCHKTTTCFRCNKKINLDKVKILYKSDLEQEIRQKIGIINKNMN